MRMKLHGTGGRELDVSIIATEPEYLTITRSGVRRGRFISWIDQENKSHVCVLGMEAARKVFGFNDPLEKMVRVGTEWYRVVGILENAAALPAAGGDDVNNYMFIPLATARACYGDFSYSSGMGSSEAVKVQLDEMIVQMDDKDLVVPAARRLGNYLASTHKLTDYNVIVPAELIRQDLAVRRTWTIVMVVFAGISLVVGGVGIMNIMLANVSDRRKEIGTRRALGARRRDILRQFLLEAATLTTLGGLAGVGAGYVAAKEVTVYANWPTIITPASVFLSLAVATLVGLIFGAFPAWQAAKVSPIEALRSE
jgi:putative ABC transport system permease protein